MLTSVFFACQKPDVVSANDDNTLSAIWATLPGDVNNTYNAVFSPNKDTAYITMPYYTVMNPDSIADLRRIILHATIPFDSKINPPLGQQMDLTSPVKLTITSGTGSKKEVVVVVKRVGDYSISKMRIVLPSNDTIEGLVSGDSVFFLVLPGINVSNVPLYYTINSHSVGSVPNGGRIDLSRVQPFYVTGADSVRMKYNLKVVEPRRLDYGFGIYRKLWYAPLNLVGGNPANSNETSITVSGNYLLVLSNYVNSKIRVYDRFTLQYVSDISIPTGLGSNRAFNMAADSLGRFVVSWFTPTGSTFYVYKYQSVTDASPVRILTFPYSGSAGSSIGRRIRIFGDLNQNASIMTTVAAGSSVLRWNLTGGNVVSTTPDIMPYGSLTMPTGAANWGIGADALPTTATTGGNYFVHYLGELALVNGASNAKIAAYPKTPDVTAQFPLAQFKFNNANYLVSEHFTGPTFNSAYFNVFDITNPAQFGNPTGKVLTSESTPAAASNANATGDVCVAVSPDRTKAHVYMLVTNGGILCYELTLYAR